MDPGCTATAWVHVRVSVRQVLKDEGLPPAHLRNFSFANALDLHGVVDREIANLHSPATTIGIQTTAPFPSAILSPEGEKISFTGIPNFALN